MAQLDLDGPLQTLANTNCRKAASLEAVIRHVRQQFTCASVCATWFAENLV